jgi:hypothetical protein
MTTTFAGRLIATVRPSFPVRLLDKYFYFSMSLLIAAVVVAGFSRTVNQRLLHPAVPPPSVLWVHGVVFSAWVLFFILQSGLVRMRKVRWHRTLGWFGVALGAAVFILGVTTTIMMHRFLYFQLHRETAIRSISVPLLDIVCFGGTFGLAVAWRKKPEYHRRLMLVATCALTAAAFGRLPHSFLPPRGFYAGVDLLILLGVARDLIVTRSVHRVYLVALPVFIAGQTFVALSITTSWWYRIAKWILL